MVNQVAGWAVVLLVALLSGCQDDLGKGLNGEPGSLTSPGSLKATANGGSEVLLTWEDRAMNESGYRLEVSSQPFSSSTVPQYVILAANSTAYSHASTPNTPYYFRVFAVTDTLESEPSNETIVMTPNVPERPQINSAWGVGFESFNLTWSLVSGETGYQIEISRDSGATWTPTPTLVPARINSAHVEGLEPDTQYHVRVLAVGPYGNSTPSWVVVVTTPPLPPSPY